MISDDELAAVTAALAILAEPEESVEAHAPPSRWKFAARNPELEIEDYRSV